MVAARRFRSTLFEKVAIENVVGNSTAILSELILLSWVSIAKAHAKSSHTTRLRFDCDRDSKTQFRNSVSLLSTLGQSSRKIKIENAIREQAADLRSKSIARQRKVHTSR